MHSWWISRRISFQLMHKPKLKRCSHHLGNRKNSEKHKAINLLFNKLKFLIRKTLLISINLTIVYSITMRKTNLWRIRTLIAFSSTLQTKLKSHLVQSGTSASTQQTLIPSQQSQLPLNFSGKKISNWKS